MLKPLSALLAAIALVTRAAVGFAGPAPQSGQFQANGKTVDEFHCSPAGSAKAPAVVLLHGAAPKGASDADFRTMCSDLAEHGYFAEFIEYYSQTEAVGPQSPPAKFTTLFPVWLNEIDAGIGELEKNPRVDGSKVCLMGFSLGGALSLSEGAADAGEVTTIVDYYGPVFPPLKMALEHAPLGPTLIIHGDKDSLVPVSQSKDLAKALSDQNRTVELHEVSGCPACVQLSRRNRDRVVQQDRCGCGVAGHTRIPRQVPEAIGGGVNRYAAAARFASSTAFGPSTL